MRDHNYHSRKKNCHCDFFINCWQWKIIVWEKEITIRDYRLVFSELVRHDQSAESIFVRFSLILKNGRATLRAEDRVYWFSNEYCWKNRFRLYLASDHVGLEIYARKLTQKNAYRCITVTKDGLSARQSVRKFYRISTERIFQTSW